MLGGLLSLLGFLVQLVNLLTNSHVIYLEANWALAGLHLFLALLAAHIVE